MMDSPLFWVVAAAVLLVLAILVYGIMGFAKGGQDSAKKSNKVMQWRIVAQAAAVVLILLFVFLRQQTGGN